MAESTHPIPAGLEPDEAFRSFLEGLGGTGPRRLILVNPPQVPQRWFQPEIARVGRYFIYPPTGLLYIAAAAREANPDQEIRILDLNYEMLRRAQGDDDVGDFWKVELARAPR